MRLTAITRSPCPTGAEFADQEAASFRFTRTVSIDDALAWLASNSAFITASAADRAAGLASCRAALEPRAGESSMIEMPMRSWCWRASALVNGNGMEPLAMGGARGRAAREPRRPNPARTVLIAVSGLDVPLAQAWERGPTASLPARAE